MSITRRMALQVGCSSAAGLTLPQLCGGALAAARDRTGITAKSVMLVYLPGAPSQIDTFDMKPNAPADIRGSFKPISTAVQGTHICEHMPLLAQCADQFTIVRSMELTTIAGAHEHATPLMLGGDRQTAARNHAGQYAERLALLCLWIAIRSCARK